MPTIRIPTPLRPYTGGQSEVAVSGNTVGDALADLTRQHPDLRPHLFEGDSLRSFVNIYLNQEDVRYLEGAETAVSDNDTLLIIPSIAGGKGGV
ncbi:MAG: MoaD/ThiS family protein [Chloroflexi bacterium]|nr:MAG: MoaD/ThiS family protein [Chloroflexota bacterium]